MTTSCFGCPRRRPFLKASVAALFVGLLVAGCGDAADSSGGPAILPHQSPVSFGELYPQGNRDPEPGSSLRTPYEWVLLLQSSGDDALKINKVCLVGTREDGADVSAFTVEVENQDLPATVESRRDFGVRLTYDRQSPTADADQIALVVQSNATNFPTLIVPVCARVIAEGEERGSVACEAPVSVPAGESDPTLCD